MNVGERYNIRTGVTEGQLIHRCVTAMYTSTMVISWVLVLLSYVLEAVFGVWAGVTYFLVQDYALFGVTATCILPACLFLSVVSLIWYYDLDKYYIGLKESHPHDQQLQRYSRFLHFGSVLAHLLLFGQLYRYCQLIFHTCSQRSIVDQASLKRDAGLVRFLHGFLSSAPMVVVQLYVVIQTLVMGQDFLKAIYPITLASLLASTISLLLTLLAYIASDRLHEEGRRVVWVGYIAMFLWHLMMVAARISVLVMFAHTFGFYVSIVVGVHWIVTLIWLLFERTNFCGESTSRPPKRRFYFEIPFAFLLSFVFLFIYFNVKDSSSLVRSIVYHLLTAIETAILASLFYAFNSTLSYTPWWFGFSVGLYLIGIAIMSLYYCAWHPNRTDNCFMIGLPKHCCGCCSRRDKGPAIGNVDLPLRDTSSSSGGEDRVTPTIRVQEDDTYVQRTGQTPDRLTVTPVSSSAYNRLDPTPGRSGGLLPLSTQLNYSSQSGVLGERYSSQNGESSIQHQPYYQLSSVNVQRSHSHNQPRPRRETWFRDDRRNSDLPFGSSTQHPYRSVLGGGAAYVSDFAVTRQHLPQHNGYISRPSSGWSGNESGMATSLQRTPSNQYPSRSSTPFPTVQVNGIRDSVTELNQPAIRPRSYGNPLYTSSAAYSSSPHIRSHEGVVYSNPASRPQSRGSYASRNSAQLHLPDSSKRQDCLWIGMSHSRSGGFLPKHSPLLSHHQGPKHYSHVPINTPSPHTRPHSSIHYCEDSTGGCSTAYHANDQGRESRATNDRSTSRSSSEGAYNQRVSGIFDPDGVCDSHVTSSIVANNYSPPSNSISLHSTGGTLV